MKDVKRGSRTVWDCKYHLFWTTKYRYQVLKGDIGQRCREIAMSKEMIIYSDSNNRDHVHMLIGVPSQLSVSRVVQYLKGRSLHRLLSEYKVLRKRYWGQYLWARGYWVAAAGNVTDGVWKECIKNEQPPEPDDEFTVV